MRRPTMAMAMVATIATINNNSYLCILSLSTAFILPSPRRHGVVTCSFFGTRPHPSSCLLQCSLSHPNDHDGAGGRCNSNKIIEGMPTKMMVRDTGCDKNDNDDDNNNDPTGHTAKNNILAVETYLQNELHLSPPDITNLKQTHPHLFHLSLTDHIEPVIFYLYTLLGHDDLWATEPMVTQTKRVAEIIVDHPRLLMCDVETHLEPCGDYIRDYCELTEDEMRMVIANVPGMLELDVVGDLMPRMEVLMDYVMTTTTTTTTTTTPGVTRGGGDGDQKRCLNDDDGNDVEEAKVLLREYILKHPRALLGPFVDVG